MHNDFSTLFEEIWMKYRYGHKQQLSHKVLLYIPLVDFLWSREIQYLQYYYLYEVKKKKWSHFYVQSS